MDTGFPVTDERRRKKKQARARPPIRPCGPILARNELHCVAQRGSSNPAGLATPKSSPSAVVS
jgi:hypothetical protein